MLLKISWRNIWRHPARSAVLIAAIVAGLWAGITISSLTNGMLEQRFNNLIQEELTHIQIHHSEFISEREPSMYIEPAGEILHFLENEDRVRSFTPRTIVEGMVQSPLTTSGVQIRGIVPEREVLTTTFHENIITGEYLDIDLRNPVIIGKRLADKLKSETGQRIVLTFQDVNNELISGSFNVAGIYQTASGPYDERNVFVRSGDIYELIAGTPVFHEIAIMLHDVNMTDQFASELNNKFNNIAAETWYELSPELRFITDSGGTFTVYVMIVIMLALAFGILNTMLMAIFERMRELGMLMAIGMNKLRVFVMIMLESVILSLAGAAIGMVFAYFTVEYLGRRGIDLTIAGGDSMIEFGYDPVVYPFIYGSDFLMITLFVIITAVAAATYPAVKALRLNPAEVVGEK